MDDRLEIEIHSAPELCCEGHCISDLLYDWNQGKRQQRLIHSAQTKSHYCLHNQLLLDKNLKGHRSRR